MSRRDAGFSIIELLVSLAVLGMASALVVSGIGVGNRVWERAEQRTAIVDSVAAAQAIVRDKIASTVPVTAYIGQPFTDFEGERDRLFFHGPALAAERPDAIVSYRLSMSTGAELVLSTATDLAPGEEGDPVQRRDLVLMRNVEDVVFDYYGAAPPDNTRRWRDRWFRQPRPPELVRVRARFPEGDSRSWPALVVRPGASTDLSCIFSTSSGRCKGRR